MARKTPKTTEQFEREWKRHDKLIKAEFVRFCNKSAFSELFLMYKELAQPDHTASGTFTPLGIWKKETLEEIFLERLHDAEDAALEVR